MDIQHESDGAKGRYVTRIGDGPGADLTYSRAGEGLIIIDHTVVPEAYRGQGVGAALVEHVVQEARKGKFSIVPLCPFAAAQFRRHPDWQDVLSQTMKRKEP